MSRPARLSASLAAATVAVSLVSVTALTPAAAQPGPARVLATEDYAPTACPTMLPTEVLEGRDVVCGYVTVPLRHEDPAAGTIELAVAVLKAASVQTPLPPVMVLAGGPGESLLTPLGLLAGGSFFTGLAQDRDVVLFDQRGVGQSRPALECPEVFTALVEGGTLVSDEEATALAGSAFAACGERLVAEGADLSAFTTVQNAADVDAVRVALGYGQVDLVGASYGTTLGLEVVRDSPTWVRTLSLVSPVPPSESYVGDLAPNFQDALDAVTGACAGDPACAGAYPDLAGTLGRAAARLEGAPALVPVPLPDGSTVEVPFTAADLGSSVFTLFYSSQLLQKLPAVVAAIEAEDYSLLVALSSSGGAVGGLSLGLQTSIQCAEEVAAADRGAVEAGLSEVSLLVSEFVRNQPVIGLPAFDICADWPVPAAPAEASAPVQTSIPTLVATGRYDQITSPSYGDVAAATLPNAVEVEVSGGHSALLQSECGLEVLTSFLADPSVAPQAGCLSDELAFDLLPQRLSGPDRYATAAAVATASFDPGVAQVYVASGTGFADALSASPVAGRTGSPVLLVGDGAVPAATLAALETLVPQAVTVVGGTAAVSDATLAELAAATGVPVTRVAGADRYATSVALASGGVLGDVERVYLATGADFADALAAAPAAAQDGSVLLLTAADALSTTTASALRGLAPAEVTVLGGSAAVGEEVLLAAQRLVPAASVTRVEGADRYATAAALAASLGEQAADGPVRAYLATGTSFPDALAGGAAAASAGAPLLLVAPGGPLPTLLALSQLDPQQLVVLGGPAAVDEATVLAAFFSS